MVVGHLRVVDEPPPERALARARRQVLAVRRRDRFDDPRQRARHVLREMPAVGARIADQLVPFVQRLRDVERLLRAEAVQAVGVPLQLRQVVEQRRRHALRLATSIDSMAACPVRARATMRFGLFAIGGQAHGLLQRLLVGSASGASRNQVP